MFAAYSRSEAVPLRPDERPAAFAAPEASEKGLRQHVHDMCEGAGEHHASHVEVGDSVVAFSTKLPQPTSFAHVSHGTLQLSVVFRGQLNNVDEIRQLYRIPDTLCDDDPAQLLAALYSLGFEDKDGDTSDQPATCINSLEGDFAFLLFDESRRYLLVARDRNGAQPLYWGSVPEEGPLLFSSDLHGLKKTIDSGVAAEFPPGCMFESYEAASSHAAEEAEYGWGNSNILRFTSATKRHISTIPRVDSHGQVCGIVYRSQSGVELNQIPAGGNALNQYGSMPVSMIKEDIL